MWEENVTKVVVSVPCDKALIGIHYLENTTWLNIGWQGNNKLLNKEMGYIKKKEK